MPHLVAWMFSVATMIVGAGVESDQDYPNKAIRMVTPGLGPMLAIEGVFNIDRVPIMDAVSVAMKMAESLVDLQKLGLKVSRKLMYRPTVPEDVSDKERAHFGFA